MTTCLYVVSEILDDGLFRFMTSQFNTLFLKWSSSLHSTKKAKWRNTICQPKCWHQSKMCSIYCATSQFPSFSLYPGSNYLRRGHGCEPDTSLKNCKWLCKLVDLDLGVSCWNREMCFTGNDLKFGMPRVLRFKKKKSFHAQHLALPGKENWKQQLWR